MDKLSYKYQEYRNNAGLEDTPTNQAAQGFLEQSKSAARSMGLMSPETPSVMSPTGDLGAMPTKAVDEQAKNIEILSAGRGPLKDAPQGSPQMRSSTPQEVQKAKAPPTAQEAYDPSQATFLEQSAMAGKSQVLQGVAGTYAGLGDFYGTLDNLAGIVSRKVGTGKPEIFEQMKTASEYWAEHYQNKVPLDDYMTKVVGGVLGSGPALVEFAMGPEWAALKGFAQNGDIGDALYSAGRRVAAGAVFGAAHRIDAAGRIAAGTAYMTGESAADQYGMTGTLDAGKTAEAAGVGLGMMLFGGLAPGNKRGLRQRLDPEVWVAFDAKGKEMDRAVEAGSMTKEARDMGYALIAADLAKNGPNSSLFDTTLKVNDTYKILEGAARDSILRDQGIDPETAGTHIIAGRSTTKADKQGALKTAIDLYMGHDLSTIAEEFIHREYNMLSKADRKVADDAYQAYSVALPEGSQPMSAGEFYAKSAMGSRVADLTAKSLAKDAPAWRNIVDATKTRWDNLVDKVKAVPGSSVAEGKIGAPAGAEGFQTTTNYQTAYHGSPYRFDKFTLDHIGSGEGAQAYGWGLYFAGEKQVAEWYREKLEDNAVRLTMKDGRVDVAMRTTTDGSNAGAFLAKHRGDFEAAIADVKKGGGSAAREVRQLESWRDNAVKVELLGQKGQLYEVTIPEPKTMLDWDKPLSEQPDQVKKALAGQVLEHNGKQYKLADYLEPSPEMVRNGHNRSDLDGRGMYSSVLVPIFGSDRAASEYLNSIGIPGLRYLDGTSRGKGEGHHNYVVFNDAQVAVDKTYYQTRPVEDIIYDPTPAPPLDQKYAEGGNTNLTKINSTEDVLKLINDVSRHNRETGAFEQATRGVRSWEETNAAAQGETRVDELLMRKEGEAGNAEQLLAARQLQAEFAAQTAGLLARAKLTGEQADKDAAAKAWGVFAAVTAARDGIVSEAGRALNIMNRPVGSGEAQLFSTAFADLARKHGGDRNADAIMNSILDMSRLNADGKLDIEELSRFARRVDKASTFDMILEARYIAMLMNPATHIKNTLGNSIALGMQVPERFLAGAIGKARGAWNDQAHLDRVELGESMAMIYGAVNGLSAGAKAFLSAVKTGESTDPLGKIETTHRAITAENMGVDPASNWGKFIDFTAERLRTGNMMLGAEDDFFKAIGYSMELNARAHRAATREGLKGQDFADRVQELTTNPPWDLQMKAMDFAHYSTFTNPLGEGMAKLQSALGTDVTVTLQSGKTLEVPTGKMFRLSIPFFRTPTNIVRYGAARSPFAVFMPSVMQALSNGGAERDLAIARVTMGSTIGFMVAAAASNGLITGGGPSDPKELENLRATGWQEYSMKVGNKWVSYKAFEPYSMIIGASADIALFDTYLEENEKNTAVTMIAGAMSEAILSKTYLQGTKDMIDVLFNPQRYGDTAIEKFAASWVPSPIKALRRDKDPMTREVWSVTDALKNSLPWLSKDLYPKRNRYGDPVTMGDVWLSNLVDPMRKSEIKNESNSSTFELDKVIQENHIPIPRTAKMFHQDGVSVQLTPEEFDDYQRLPAEFGLVEVLQRIIESPGFKNATGGPDGLKAHMIQEVYGDFRDRAKYELEKSSRGVPGGLAERLELERLERKTQQEATK